MRNMLLAAGFSALLVSVGSAQQVHRGRVVIGKVPPGVHFTRVNGRIGIGTLPKGFKLTPIRSKVTQKKPTK